MALCFLVGIGVAHRPKQNTPQMTYTQLPMSHGKDVRREFVGTEEMYDICVKRELEEVKECDGRGLSREERHKRLDALNQAGQAEINRVIASHCKEAFNPAVMDKAVRDVEEGR